MFDRDVQAFPSRRTVIRTTVAAGAGALLSSSGPSLANETKPLRVAHLTDMHVQPERHGGEGYAAALRSLDKLDPKPDLILTGGDHVMDAFEASAERAAEQWDLYQRVLRENTTIPVYAVMGNHDVWGWHGQARPGDPGYGKAEAIHRLSIKGNKPYYSFDAGPWHFICLDNVAQRDRDYFASLDGEQTEWLRADLAAQPKGKPVCVASHIPLLAACVFFDGDDRVRSDFWHVPDAWMHRDVKPLIDLLRAHGNVRLCLSGHIHLVDRVDYLGITFLCNGAVSGAWWKGPNQEFAEGYGVIDLWPDGRFEHQYVTFGWQAKE